MPHIYTHITNHTCNALSDAHIPHVHTSQTVVHTHHSEACISAHLKLISLSLTIPFPWG